MNCRRASLLGLFALSLLLLGLRQGQYQAASQASYSDDRTSRCVDMLQRSTDSNISETLIYAMQMYEAGGFSFATQAQKNEYLSKIEMLRTQYSVRDLAALKEAVQRSRLKNARQALSECTDIINGKSQAMFLAQIGEVLTDLKQADDAIPVLRRCIEIKPDCAMCWVHLGRANEALNRYSEAKASYRKAIETGGFDELNASYIRRAKILLPDLQDKPGSASDEDNSTQTSHSFGTGFFVSTDGSVLTNNHVVAGCRTIATRDGSPLRLVSRDVSSDLALLKADSVRNSVAMFRSGPAPKLGDAVVAFGFPLPGLLSSEGNVSAGILSAASGLQNDIRFVQISAPVQPGNSGGPLFDSSGHVIGVVVAKLDALKVARATGDFSQNVNFAVHWAEVRAFLEEQGVPYRKEASQRETSTRNIAASAAKITVAIDCTQ